MIPPAAWAEERSHQDDRADVGGQQRVVPQGPSITLGLHIRRTLVMELRRGRNRREVGVIHLWDWGGGGDATRRGRFTSWTRSLDTKLRLINAIDEVIG